MSAGGRSYWPTIRKAPAWQPGHTTTDGKVSLEFAECIGACEGAPCVLINDEPPDERRVGSSGRIGENELLT